MMATERIRSLCYQVSDELQMIIGGEELGDLDSSLRALDRAYKTLSTLQTELVRMRHLGLRKVIWPKDTK